MKNEQNIEPIYTPLLNQEGTLHDLPLAGSSATGVVTLAKKQKPRNHNNSQQKNNSPLERGKGCVHSR